MSKVGILINNIGSPQSPRPKDVARYLTQFLMSPGVIKLPWLWRTLLVRGWIVPFRAKSSAKKYQSIWHPEGSPLILNSMNFAKKLQRELGPQFQVELAMNFGEPSISSALKKVADCEQILFCPMFPQYDDSTTGAATDLFLREAHEQGFLGKISILSPFYFESSFLRSFAQQILITSPEDHVLFSFHGLPEKYLKCNSACGTMESCLNCYKAQCYRTAQFIARMAYLNDKQWSVSFQSRLGPTKWLSPYTDVEVTRLAEDKKNIILASPAFVADCLETLEELGIEVRHLYSKKHEGGSIHVLSCPNDQDGWVDGFAKNVRETLGLQQLEARSIIETNPDIS